MKKDLVGHAKLLKYEDQVMVIGNLNVPDQKQINKKDIVKFFKKDLKNKFYFPPPNYGTRKLIFETMVQKSGGQLSTSFDINTLAWITERYPAGCVNFGLS